MINNGQNSTKEGKKLINQRGPGTVAGGNSGVMGSKKLQGSKIKNAFPGNNTGLLNPQIGVN